MAKKSKKKPSRGRNISMGPSGSTKILRQFWAFIFIVVALFVMVGGFGWGGALPVALYKGFSWVFGYAAFLAPMALIIIAIHKFRHEEFKTPTLKFLASLALLTFIAGIMHVFVSVDNAKSYANDGKYGGMIGYLISSGSLNFLNSVTTFVLFALLSIAMMLVIFEIPVRTFFSWIIAPFTSERIRREGEITDLGVIKTNPKFTLNEGVPVVHSSDISEPKPRHSSLKNVSDKMSEKDKHSALTMVSDPNWKYPGLDLLNQQQDKADAGDVQGNAALISDTFSQFNIDVEMEGANIGPRVTQFTLKPPTGVKLTKITALESNIALDLAAQSIRIEAPIPGKRAVGIEVPNIKPATVRVSSILASKEWKEAKGQLSFVIGKDIAGLPVVAVLEKMPHLLIAGQTGSGKSVMINTLLTSLLYKNSPSDLKLILVDPKQVEMAPYHDIPHLLTPVIIEPEKCISALKWAVAEMERRLKTFAENNKRNIAEYNITKSTEKMPYIVVVIDELADLMMMAARDVEALIVRLAQKARAAGIHLVLATQRPSVDVITGLIKANVPARIAFTVASQIDSRTIIDQMGAEKLLGMGDLLFSTSDMAKPKRAQGALITDDETVKVTDFLRMQQPPQYDDEVVSMPVQLNGKGGVVADFGGGEAEDDLFKEAVKVVVEARKASTSLLQRRLRIGYGRAARIIETMEEQGIVGRPDGSRPRDVLINSIDEIGGGGESEVGYAID